MSPQLFLSTLSLRRATGIRRLLHGSESISIHALLAESDRNSLRLIPIILHFYPRSPCGERQNYASNRASSKHISIHALLAESDHWQVGQKRFLQISIHALLAESDEAKFFCIGQPIIFLSTLSLRRATENQKEQLTA